MYAHLTPNEVVEAFVIHRRIIRMGYEASPLRGLMTCAYCWWSKERPMDNRTALRQQMGGLIEERPDIDADHARIIGHPVLIQDLRELSIIGAVT